MSALSEKLPYMPLLVIGLLFQLINWFVAVPLIAVMLSLKWLTDKLMKYSAYPLLWSMKKLNQIDERYKNAK